MVTHATICMGQGIGVTPLQILRAICAVANGGSLVQPHLLMPGGPEELSRVAYHPQNTPLQVLKPTTASTLHGMMRDVVAEGTGKSAQLEGFSAAGKTGTAQKTEKREKKTVYSHSKFVASFVGFAPLENPVIAVVVAIDEPKGLYYGGEVAAPVFRGIAEKVLRYLSVAPDQPLTPQQLAQVRKRQGEQASKDPDVGMRPVEGDWNFTAATRMVSEEEEVPLAPLDPSAEVNAATAANQDFPPVEVPDFTGKSMRAVLSEIARLGLDLNAMGSGMAVLQMPPAHSRVNRGAKVSVRFSRRMN